MKSFLTKCARKSAKTTCDASAKEKKLAGAAKTSFTKKCVADATGRVSDVKIAIKARKFAGRKTAFLDAKPLKRPLV